jgi:hypothetical protein
MGEAPWGFRSRCRTWFCRCGFAVNSADRTWDDMGRIEKLTLPIFPHLSLFLVTGCWCMSHLYRSI